MDISVALCNISRAKVVHSTSDCSVLLAEKSRSQRGDSVITHKANNSMKQPYNLCNNRKRGYTMNNTYYVLSMGWMHSHKLQITLCMNLHIIGKSGNVLCTQNSVALRYTQLSPATAVACNNCPSCDIVKTLCLKEFPNFLFSGP